MIHKIKSPLSQTSVQTRFPVNIQPASVCFIYVNQLLCLSLMDLVKKTTSSAALHKKNSCLWAHRKVHKCIMKKHTHLMFKTVRKCTITWHYLIRAPCPITLQITV